MGKGFVALGKKRSKHPPPEGAYGKGPLIERAFAFQFGEPDSEAGTIDVSALPQTVHLTKAAP